MSPTLRERKGNVAVCVVYAGLAGGNFAPSCASSALLPVAVQNKNQFYYLFYAAAALRSHNDDVIENGSQDR